MGPFGDGWAVALNGVVLTSGCSGDTAAEDLTIVQNLIPNPSFETDLTHWDETNPAQSTATVTGDESYAGSASVQIDATVTTGSDMGIELDTPADYVTCVENDHLYVSGWFLKGDPATLDAEVTVSFFTVADVLISSTTGTPVTLTDGTWARASVDEIAPANTAKARVRLNFAGGATSGDIVGWIDAAMVTISDDLSDWFDGDTIGTTSYGYAWDGTTDDSTSTRTPCALIYGTTVLEALTDTPKGLGHPDMRTEDTTYPQRDGVVHWNDYYGPRFITIKGTLHPPSEGCVACTTTREQVMLLSQAYKRQCNDVEIVLYPPCEAGTDIAQRVITGPYGVVGRPRVFEKDDYYRDDAPVDFLIRFDGADHRAYVLDPCGTPGSMECYQIEPGAVAEVCANLPMCFTGAGFCFDNVITPAIEPTDVTIEGTECVNPTITLYPGLTRPQITNVTTGDWLGYNAVITGEPVVIDTENGVATQGGVSVTHNLIGSLQFQMTPGEYELELSTQSGDDDGYANVCYRPTVLVM